MKGSVLILMLLVMPAVTQPRGIAPIPANGTHDVSTKLFAMCVVGAVRSLDDPAVMDGFRKHVAPFALAQQADIFYHLYTGTEASSKGQHAIDPEQRAGSMADALLYATSWRFQFNENVFQCDTPATGKFFKISSCAGMVLQHAKAEHVTYKYFLVFRPDFKITSFILPNMSAVEPGWAAVRKEGACDCVMASFHEGVRVAQHLTHQTTCCDKQNRTPTGCFLPGLETPSGNFMFDTRWYGNDAHHLRNEMPRVGVFSLGSLVRTSEQLADIAGRDMTGLHGSTRNVPLSEDSQVLLSPVLAWPRSCAAEMWSCRVDFMKQALKWGSISRL